MQDEHRKLGTDKKKELVLKGYLLCRTPLGLQCTGWIGRAETRQRENLGRDKTGPDT